MFQKLKCLFGQHEPSVAFSQFVDGLFPGKFTGHHRLYNVTYCKHCNKRQSMETVLEIRDNFNILRNNSLPTEKTKEVEYFILNTEKTIKEISEITKVSESTVRRILKRTTANI
jgi:DNA-directed RNA polymerase sigma subunit (sigma70/sigma32)